MMFVSIGIGTLIAVALIVVVSILTGGPVQNDGGLSSNLVGHKVQTFSLAGLNGGKVRAPWATGHAGVLIFFASYCGPCHKEMPEVATYIRKHSPSPIVVMGVDASDKLASGQTFVKNSKVTFPVAFDPNDVVTSGIFQFEEVPETVFVSKEGVVTQVYFGAIPVSQLKSGIASLQ
jgi:cytochrome c biogenesis protein CcmG, thiol:disulfide interchange protein DsbE